MNWTKICQLQDVPTLGSRVLETDEGRIAIFRNSIDEVFALQDCCFHKGGPLSQGIVHGKHVTCPLHNKVTDLNTGIPAAPEKGCTKRYPVLVKEGTIVLALDVEKEMLADANSALYEDATA